MAKDMDEPVVMMADRIIEGSQYGFLDFTAAAMPDT